MKRSMCGLAVVAAAAAVWSCNGDPTGDFRGQGEHVLANPSVVVVGQGAQKFVLVERVDEQGNQETVDFQLRNLGPGIAVEKDPTFLETTIGTHLPTRERFIVTGNELLNSSFTVESGGDTLLIPVTVTPNEVAPTFSTTTPAQNQPVTVTVPAGYKFLPGAFITFGADVAVVLSRTADSTSFTFVPQPLLPDPTEIPPTPKNRVGILDSVQVDYIPGIPLTLPTVDSVLIPLLDTVPGTGAPGTAPTIATPILGESSAFFDTGGFPGADVTGDGGVGTQYYKFTMAEAGSVTITLNWPASNAADLDLVLCMEVTCNPATNDFVAAGASHPEAGDYNLAAGTYVIAAVFFAPSTTPPVPPDFPTGIDILITRTD